MFGRKNNRHLFKDVQCRFEEGCLIIATGSLPQSKQTYIKGTIAIDGGGVYVKPFGMLEGKNWVLLANNIKGSMMTNAIGMKVAQLAGTAGANHIVPVDLYINNDYRGSYNFTEKVGFHNNSIDLDVDAFAAYYLTNEYILNMELLHPKSTYLYKERVGNPACLWKFGPVWDLDWAFGHELDYGYFTTGATSDYVNAKEMECNNLWRALRKAGEAQDRAYYIAWTRFLRQKSVEELVDFCQEYYNYVKPSFEKNHKKWGDGLDYANQIAKQQKWLKSRAEYVYNGLTAYDISEELPDSQAWEPYGSHEWTSGIQSMEQPSASQGEIVAIYDLSGRKLQTLQKGINIVHYRNGKAKVVLRK